MAGNAQLMLDHRQAGDHAEQHRHVGVHRHAAMEAVMRMQQHPRRNRMRQQRTQPFGARAQQLRDVLGLEGASASPAP